MKYRLLWLVLLLTNSSIFCAFRNSAPKNPIQSEQQIAYVPIPVTQRLNPIEEDKKTDQALFVHFVKILGNFSKILINPHDKINVTSNVAKMVDGVVAVAQELTKRNLSQSQLDNLVRLLHRALVTLGHVPPSTLVGYTAS